MKFLQGLLNAARPYRLSGLVFLLFVIAGFWFGPRLLFGPKVAVTKVITRDFVQSVVATGHVEAPHRISIGTQVVGTVEHIPVTEGQVVST
ncbi:MAG: efflux RND transporter periplasmic adaptor subunit, partial [Burkholderiaceae bacterium]